MADDTPAPQVTVVRVDFDPPQVTLHYKVAGAGDRRHGGDKVGAVSCSLHDAAPYDLASRGGANALLAKVLPPPEG